MGTESKLALTLITIVLFNTAMLSVITYKGVEYRNTLRRRTEGIRTVSAVLNGVAPKEPVARQLGAVMDTLMGEFFLGSFNGSVPAFLQNVLTTDFPTIASGVSAWAAQVNATFGGRSCQDVVCAAANQRVECAGRTFWCDAKGAIIPCSQASAGCLPKSLAEGVLAIKSVADKIATFTKVNGAATTPAAMSNGIFRLDVIFDWFSAQFNYGSWVSAGQLVSNFMANLRRVDFSGCARDDNDERTQCWDINGGVTTVINTVNQISQLLAPPTVPSFDAVRQYRPKAELPDGRDEVRVYPTAPSDIAPIHQAAAGTPSNSQPAPSASRSHVVVATLSTAGGLLFGMIFAIGILHHKKQKKAAPAGSRNIRLTSSVQVR